MSEDLGVGGTCIALSSSQARQIRALGAAAASVQVTVGEPSIGLVLVGKKTGIGLWSGIVSRADDLAGVIGALEKALGMSEQVISEVNALVVVLDRNCRVRRFNKVCEEHSGLREVDMIGVDAHAMFMPPASMPLHGPALPNSSGPAWRRTRSTRSSRRTDRDRSTGATS